MINDRLAKTIRVNWSASESPQPPSQRTQRRTRCNAA
jgi:hypothetical protein